MNHEAINKIVCANGYGVGITPNPFASQCKEWQRRHEQAALRKLITDKIVSLFEPRFITPPETSECIEALVTMTEARNVLEVGTCTGFTSLHILRALVGKPGAHLTSIDFRPAHDPAFFGQEALKPYFTHLNGKTPECFASLNTIYDFVFVDSDHSIEHTNKELDALMRLTRPGTVFLFHDCPEWDRPDVHTGTIFNLLHEKVDQGRLRGTVFPTADQLDCLEMWGPGYPQQSNPHLGLFIRR